MDEQSRDPAPPAAHAYATPNVKSALEDSNGDGAPPAPPPPATVEKPAHEAVEASLGIARAADLSPSSPLSEPEAEWEAAFLAQLASSGSVTKAWKASKRTRTYCYEWRAKRPEFAKAWDEIADVHRDNLEASAMARAIQGIEEIVIFKGRVMRDPLTNKVLTVQRFDTALTIFMLKAHRPERYRGCDWRGPDNGPSPAGSPDAGPIERAKAVRAALEDLERATYIPKPGEVQGNGHGAPPPPPASSNGNGAKR